MLCPWICIAQASDMRNPRYLRTTRPGRHPCPKKLVFSWYQTCQTLCHLGGTCFFFQVMPIVLWQRQRSQMEVRCFKLVDGPFIYLLSMCLNVRCPETRWFLTRMIFRKSAGPLILLTSTPCSFGLAAVCHLLGPTLNQQFLDVPTPKISSKNMDVSLPLHSPKRLNMIWKNRYQPLPNPCQYSDHSLYTFSRKMLIRWILVSWYPFAKNQFPFFFLVKSVANLYTSIHLRFHIMRELKIGRSSATFVMDGWSDLIRSCRRLAACIGCFRGGRWRFLGENLWNYFPPWWIEVHRPVHGRWVKHWWVFRIAPLRLDMFLWGMEL